MMDPGRPRVRVPLAGLGLRKLNCLVKVHFVAKTAIL